MYPQSGSSKLKFLPAALRPNEAVRDRPSPRNNNPIIVSENPVFDSNLEDFENEADMLTDLQEFIPPSMLDMPDPASTARQPTIEPRSGQSKGGSAASWYAATDNPPGADRVPASTEMIPAGTDQTETDSSDKVKSRMMSAWNNFKYVCSVKMKTNFSYEKEIWLLGEHYHKKMVLGDSKNPALEEKAQVISMEKFKEDFLSRIWLTYRREFPVLAGSKLTTDCGWGCMLRSGQMMLAHALVCHFLGRTWRWRAPQSEKSEALHRMIVRWFGDNPSPCSPFSLHSLVAVGESLGKKAGDWYGPASVAQVLRHALDIAAPENPALDGICIYVAKDCTVYKGDVIDLCTAPSKCSSLPTSPREKTSSNSPRSSANGGSSSTPAGMQSPKIKYPVPSHIPPTEATDENLKSRNYPKDVQLSRVQGASHVVGQHGDIKEESEVVVPYEGSSPPVKQIYFRRTSSCSSIASGCRTKHDEASPSSLPSGSSEDVSCQTQLDRAEKWRGVVVIIPVRLGGEKMNSIYFPCLKQILTHESCIGIIGGRPRHSLYFIGWQDDKLIYLDPHYCQDTVDVRMSDFSLETFHCSSPRKMSFNRMDPSCAIGFYCRSKQEFLSFSESIKQFAIPQEEKSEYPMFVIAEGYSKDASHHLYPLTQEEKILKIKHCIMNEDGFVEAEIEGDDFVVI